MNVRVIKNEPTVTIAPGDTLRVVRGKDAVLPEGKDVRVAVIVENGTDYKGRPVSGVILRPYRDGNRKRRRFPFVWDANRFAKVS